ncbi:amino acid ABC transporter permease [Grimontia sp. NTOU-MAR1]|uniref:amino acid ABC transporter permease n=1 Tax=Grimontia sp. NTOU-MAR1 TaxID=3111011 RepID=UPI002DB6866B|nr:amino acid ABC transporter permease [Grimontia sp. NTOU-MAR1]WRV99109.1 amino acid ABC transporter permease [Grimontia sp. NTOU-MAR1]
MSQLAKNHRESVFMNEILKQWWKTLIRFHWGNYLLLLLIGLLFYYVWVQVNQTLNYKWNWSIIPNWIIRYDEDTQSWVPNLLLQGLITTFRLTLYSSILALLMGICLGLARTSKNQVVSMLARTYLELLRNIPQVVIIFVFYFFLSEQIVQALEIESWARSIARGDSSEIWSFFFGDMRRFPSLVSGVLVLALFESAFVGEIIRTGIQTVPKGQYEAASSIGMTRMQSMRYIILPQAFRKILPPLANQQIILVKNSAFVSLIAVQELAYKTTELVATTRAIFEAWLTTAAFYFVICFGLSVLFRRLEKHGMSEGR